MSELNKLNNIGRAKTQHQLDMEALQRGAMKGGSFIPHLYQAPPEPSPGTPPSPTLSPEEQATQEMQAANLKAAKTDPGMQDRLNKIAAARAKFYGEAQ